MDLSKVGPMQEIHGGDQLGGYHRSSDKRKSDGRQCVGTEEMCREVSNI